MTRRIIGAPPQDLGEFNVVGWDEYMFVQDMPIKVPGTLALVIPGGRNLEPLRALAEAALAHCVCTRGKERAEASFVYLTAKHTFVKYGSPQTRPGWHTDGFGTSDLAYLWSDCVPTRFYNGHVDVPTDDQGCLKALEKLDTVKSYTLRPKHLTALDDSVIHQPGHCTVAEGQWRRFVKLSISLHPYNLRGNAKNPALPQTWALRDRQQNRNNPEDPTCESTHSTASTS